MAWQLRADSLFEVESYQNRSIYMPFHFILILASSVLGLYLTDAMYSSAFISIISCFKTNSCLLDDEHLLEWLSVTKCELGKLTQFSKLPSKDLILSIYCDKSYYDVINERIVFIILLIKNFRVELKYERVPLHIDTCY